jgi:glycosyltransferase involved in cell wall biosynthesis
VKNPNAIAEGIERVVSDATFQRKLAANAKKYAISTFDIEVMLNDYQREYDSLIDNG